MLFYKFISTDCDDNVIGFYITKLSTVMSYKVVIWLLENISHVFITVSMKARIRFHVMQRFPYITT
jgi:hypothetical protein